MSDHEAMLVSQIDAMMAQTKREHDEIKGYRRACECYEHTVRDQRATIDTQDAEITRLRAELAAAKRERDLAIAHDRQPYPTAEAYEAVCKSLREAQHKLDLLINQYTGRIDIGKLLGRISELENHLKELISPLDDAGHWHEADRIRDLFK